MAKRHLVSLKIVEHVLKNFSLRDTPNFSLLPKVLMVNEFREVSVAEGAMAFICTYVETGKIIDSLDNKRLFNLIRYFN